LPTWKGQKGESGIPDLQVRGKRSKRTFDHPSRAVREEERGKGVINQKPYFSRKGERGLRGKKKKKKKKSINCTASTPDQSRPRPPRIELKKKGEGKGWER